MQKAQCEEHSGLSLTSFETTCLIIAHLITESQFKGTYRRVIPRETSSVSADTSDMIKGGSTRTSKI